MLLQKGIVKCCNSKISSRFFFVHPNLLTNNSRNFPSFNSNNNFIVIIFFIFIIFIGGFLTSYKFVRLFPLNQYDLPNDSSFSSSLNFSDKDDNLTNTDMDIDQDFAVSFFFLYYNLSLFFFYYSSIYLEFFFFRLYSIHFNFMFFFSFAHLSSEAILLWIIHHPISLLYYLQTLEY